MHPHIIASYVSPTGYQLVLEKEPIPNGYYRVSEQRRGRTVYRGPAWEDKLNAQADLHQRLDEAIQDNIRYTPQEVN